MLKEIFSRNLNTQSKTVCNAIITLGDTDDSGKGRKFKSRFIQPGIAGYPEQFGSALIRKESFDKFIYSLRGKSVIINHKDVITEEDKVGEVYNVWFNQEDGWYWCDGIIWDETAQNLITDKGWSVSCSYDVKLADDAGGTENNIPYDIEFLDGVFTHLAIVDNPRYERANIVFNSKTVVKNATEDALGNLHSESNGQFVSKNNNKSFYNETTKTIELKGDELGFTDEEIRENGLKYFKENYQGKKFDNSELKGILFSNPGIKKFYTNSADIHKIKAIPALKDIIEKGKYQGSEDLSHPRQDGIIKFHRINHNVSIDGHKENMSVLIGEDKNGNKFYNLNHRTYTAENSSRGERAIGVANEEFSINIITDIQEDFNPDIKNNVENNKENTEMALIDELKKLITKVENDKGEDMDDIKEKVDNEKVDKRDIIRQIMAIAGKHEDNEDVRTIAKLAEKLAYDKSEAGTADNEKEDEEPKDEKVDNKKVKNEETEEDEKKYDDLKKDVKEDVENKCKNSVDNSKGGFFDKMNEIYNSAMQPKQENLYVSRADNLKAAEEYFAK